MKAKRRDTTVAVISFAVIMIAWWLGTTFTNVNKVFLPSPQSVVETIIELAKDGSLWEHTWRSTYRVLIGWLLSVAAALPLGMLAATSRVCRAVFQPVTEFMRYLPVVALVPLTLLYFGIGESQKYAIIFLGTFFQLMLMVVDSVSSVDQNLMNAAATLGANRFQQYFRVLLPAALPSLMDDMRLTIGWAWTYLVVAEMVAADAGLGYMILKNQRFLATDVIFAGLIMIGLVGLVTDWIFRVATRLIVPWQERLNAK